MNHKEFIKKVKEENKHKITCIRCGKPCNIDNKKSNIQYCYHCDLIYTCYKEEDPLRLELIITGEGILNILKGN